MERHVIGSILDRTSRNGINNNFEYLFEGAEKVEKLSLKASEVLAEAEDTVAEAKNINELNKDVQKQLDDIILESGTSDAEVVQARGGNNTLNERLTKMSTDLKFAVTKAEGLSVSVRDFGAKGDDTDQYAQIQEALDYVGQRGGGKVFMPEGIYRITDTLVVPSEVTFVGDGMSTVIKRQGAVPYPIRSDGEFGERVDTTADVHKGSTEIPVTSASHLKSGDYIRVMSQRDAQHEDAGDYRMGRATSNDHKVYIGEIMKIERINGNTIVSRTGTSYPDYLTHKNYETSPKARDRTTVDLVKFNSHVHIGNFKLEGLFTEGIRINLCRHSSVFNVEWSNISVGSHTMFSQCYETEGRDLRAFYNATVMDNYDYYRRNPFKIRSCHASGFDNVTSHYASQMVDFTYYGFGEGSIFDSFSYVKNSKSINAKDNGVTAHGGTYMVKVMDNEFLGCSGSGIGMRSRNAIISGNIIQGVRTPDANIKTAPNYGIAMFDGSCQDSLVQNNIIKSFGRMIDVSDGRGYPYKHVGINISDNVMQDYIYGINVRRPYNISGDKPNANANLVIHDNYFQSMVHDKETRDIYIDEWYRGIDIRDNTFITQEGNTLGRVLRTSGNVFDINFDDNVVSGYGDDAIYVYPVTDTDTFPYTRFPVHYGSGNIFSEFPRRFRLQQLNIQPSNHVGSFHPMFNGVGSLGHSKGRWTQLYSEMNPNVSSDRRIKRNIVSIHDGLEFIKQLDAVSYNKNDEVKTEFGVIAQDVECALENMAYDSDNLTILDKSNPEKMGLSYSEIIPFLIKAVQELDEKISKK